MGDLPVPTGEDIVVGINKMDEAMALYQKMQPIPVRRHQAWHLDDGTCKQARPFQTHLPQHITSHELPHGVAEGLHQQDQPHVGALQSRMICATKASIQSVTSNDGSCKRSWTDSNGQMRLARGCDWAALGYTSKQTDQQHDQPAPSPITGHTGIGGEET